MNGTQIFALVTGMLSGLSLFMFGMNVMSDTLTQLAGGKLSGVIDKITANRFAGWGFGTILSVFVQSSVTTVMVVGLVNSGIMTVTQSAGVMIGANLGTTATAWLLSLNSLGGSFWLQLLKPSSFTPFLAIGVMIGMDMMSNAVAPLQNVPAFNRMMLSVSNPFIGVLVGIACTLMIQSSAAAIGILQALAMSVGVTYGMAIPIVCGAQVGTCLTAVLASLSGSNKGKRAGMIHLFYNLIRNTLFLVIFYILAGMLKFSFMGNVAGAVGIAAFHTLINLLGSAVFLPISRLLVKLVHMVLPFSAAEKEEEADTLTILDPLFLRNPAFAIDQVRTASFMLADVVQEYYDLYLDMIDKNLPEQSEDMRLTGVKAERYVSQLRKYCIRLSEHKMHDQEARNLAYLSSAVNNFAEMAEKIKGMTESFIGLKKSGESFSEGAKKDIATFGSAVQEILEATVHDYATQNTRLASTVQNHGSSWQDQPKTCEKTPQRRVQSGKQQSFLRVLYRI